MQPKRRAGRKNSCPVRTRWTGSLAPLGPLGLVLLAAGCPNPVDPEGFAPAAPDAGFVTLPDAGPVDERDAGPVVCEDDEHEENDVRAEATAVESGAVMSAVYCGDDDDFWSIASAPGCAVSATVTFDASGGRDLDLFAQAPSGVPVGAGNTLGGVERVNVEATESGAYAFRVRGSSRDAVAYTVVLESICDGDLSCPADDAFEDNDTLAAAAPLVRGVATDAIVCGDDDFYAVPVQLGCLADIGATFVDANGDIDLELRTQAGDAVVASSRGSGDSERILDVVTEPVALRVFGFGAAENAYRVTVDEICQGQLQCPGDDPFVGNSTVEDATRINREDEVIGVVCGALDDHYSFAPQANCAVDVELEYDVSRGDLDLRLLDSAGAQLAQSNGTGNAENITHTPTSAARLVARVVGFGSDSGAYRLRVRNTCP